MARNKNDYFKLIEQQVGFSVEASRLLEQILSNYSAGNIADQKEKMHAIEHKADELHHTVLTNLSSEFITPIDQEDILGLVQIIDDVTDAIDEVILEFYMFRIEEMPAFAADIAKIVNRCVTALYEAAKELKNFKKPERLRKLLVEVNTIEGEADEMYVKAVHSLFTHETSSRILIGNKAIYESLENCCDLCEHAADVIEQIIIKNT
ncbi:MAG: DUF47 domain-containing protein [Acutalibacteraceae bacterium]|jgi:predicted phosphate transport protein (TIGR00153 family)